MAVLSIFKHALIIGFFVFVMMLLVDFIDTASHRRMSDLIQGGRWRQYTLASFLGSTPGCLGAFMNVSLYVHGMISFGAIVGGMIATSGDEAFVMLTQFPLTALLLFASLFVAGIFFAWISDGVIRILGVNLCQSCRQSQCEACEDKTNEAVVPLGKIFQPAKLYKNIRSLSFTRFLLLALIVSFMIIVATGILGPDSWNWKRIKMVLEKITMPFSNIFEMTFRKFARFWGFPFCLLQ